MSHIMVHSSCNYLYNILCICVHKRTWQALNAFLTAQVSSLSSSFHCIKRERKRDREREGEREKKRERKTKLRKDDPRSFIWNSGTLERCCSTGITRWTDGKEENGREMLWTSQAESHLTHLVLLLASELYNLGYVAFSSKDTFYITYKHLQ